MVLRTKEVGQIVREMRRRRLHRSGEVCVPECGEMAVLDTLPHRDPFKFVDRILEIDKEQKTLLAVRHVDVGDPVFAGHFPGAPIFPASLQIEAIGQACICLWCHVENNSERAGQQFVVSKVEQAIHLNPVRPGDTMQLTAKLIYSDDLNVIAAGQVYVDDQLCAALVVNVVFVDG